MLARTVTERGTVTIPVEIRKKYNLKKGSKVSFIEKEHGAPMVRVSSLADQRGIDKNRKELVYKMIRELHDGKRGAQGISRC